MMGGSMVEEFSHQTVPVASLPPTNLTINLNAVSGKTTLTSFLTSVQSTLPPVRVYVPQTRGSVDRTEVKNDVSVV